MQEFNDYIRNIMYLVIFMTFVGIISPGGSYKKYIDIVLGLVLIIVIISPVAAFLGGRGGGAVAGEAVARILEGSEIAGLTEYDEAFFLGQRDRILGEHVNAIIRTQLDALLEGTPFSIYLSEANFAADTGALIDLRLAVLADENFNDTSARGDTPQVFAGRPFIRVERVEVSLRETRRSQVDMGRASDVPDDESLQLLKRTISDFYNIDVDNIYIEVLMRRG